jgi:LppP/LprE lipoprotein
MGSRGRRSILPYAATLAVGLSLIGCGGGGTKTVTAANAPAPEQTASTTTPSTTHRATTKTSTATTPANTTSGAQTTTSGGTSGPTSTTTRTAPAPAFTKPETGGEGLSGAEAVVRAKGFTATETSDYHSGQALRVLIGTRNGSSDGRGQQAFFFVNNSYIGTDAKEPSATVKVMAQSDTEVTLAYPLYRPSDPTCCPGGGQTTVRFQLNNGKLTPLGPIPPASSTTGLSRQ